MIIGPVEIQPILTKPLAIQDQLDKGLIGEEKAMQRQRQYISGFHRYQRILIEIPNIERPVLSEGLHKNGH